MKKRIKVLLDVVFRAATICFYLFYLLSKPVLSDRKAFSSLLQFFSLFPGVTGEWLRRALLQWITGRPLTDCCICFGTLFSDPELVMGNRIYIGPGSNIGKALIRDDCVIGSGVHILSGQHQHFFDRLDVPVRDQGGRFERVGIGKNTWIGNGAVIASDVGENCVIGAGSVVVRPIPAFSVAVGNPARIVSNRNTKE